MFQKEQIDTDINTTFILQEAVNNYMLIPVVTIVNSCTISILFLKKSNFTFPQCNTVIYLLLHLLSCYSCVAPSMCSPRTVKLFSYCEQETHFKTHADLFAETS